MDDKTARVFRFAVLLAGLVATGASIVVSREPLRARVPTWVVVALSIGLLLLVAAGVLALLGYRATKLRVGLRAESLRDAVDDEDLDEATFHREALQAYADGIVDNSQSLNETVAFLNPATWVPFSRYRDSSDGNHRFIVGHHPMGGCLWVGNRVVTGTMDQAQAAVASRWKQSRSPRTTPSIVERAARTTDASSDRETLQGERMGSDDEASSNEADGQEGSPEGRFEMETIQMGESPAKQDRDLDGITTMEKPPDSSDDED